ncbi:hypothetical protein WHR41_02601 [Cladosporium halotolerans]|uniref:Small ribosomal subunit protein mS37 n=1 Tax=Cladosporium halotolerans TaxID=1052096 RepID=A0AB34L0F1_9PEZI
MVAGKDSTRQLAKAASAPKLPPLPKLRIRRPDQTSANPCLNVMSSVLSCWASSGNTGEGCAQLEQQLRACMDERKGANTQKNKINSHLSRLYPQIIGPHKRK